MLAGFDRTRSSRTGTPCLIVLLSVENLPVEKHGFARVISRIVPAVAARIKVSFMRIAGFSQNFVQLLGPDFEAVPVLVYTVEVEIKTIEYFSVHRQFYGVVLFSLVLELIYLD